MRAVNPIDVAIRTIPGAWFAPDRRIVLGRHGVVGRARLVRPLPSSWSRPAGLERCSCNCILVVPRGPFTRVTWRSAMCRFHLPGTHASALLPSFLYERVHTDHHRPHLVRNRARPGYVPFGRRSPLVIPSYVVVFRTGPARQPLTRMNDTSSSLTTFEIVSEAPGPRFLGLSVGERNRRVAYRCGGVPTIPGSALPTLLVPAGVAVTPELFEVLPPPVGVWHLLSDRADAPIVWRGATAPGDRAHLFQLPSGAALDVSTAQARRKASWRLLNGSGKPADGWLSRHLHRRVSRIFSYLFLSAGLSANFATFATLGIGIASAWLMAQTSHATMIAAGFLFWCASIADGIDGEMARLTLSESRRGEQLDTAVDQLTYAFGLAGVLIGWSRQGIGWPGLILAMTVVVGIPTVLFWAMAMVRRARKTDQLFVPTKPIEAAVFAAARQLDAPTLRASAAVFAVFRREAFSLTFFLVSLVTGSRAVYPMLLAGGLAIVTLTFLLHHAALSRQLEQEFA